MDNEQEVVFEPIPGTSQEFAIDTRCDHTLFCGTRGGGKDIALDTPVLTNNGWKNAGKVNKNDLLVGLNGNFVKLLGIYPKSNRPIYKIKFFDGECIFADAEHRWLCFDQKTGYRDGWKVKTTAQIRDSNATQSVPYLQCAVEGLEWQGLDPYWIGYMIANGTTKSQRLCAYTIDDEILEYGKSLGWYSWEGKQTAKRSICPAGLEQQWREVIPCQKGDQKHVPEQLLWASAKDRLALLQGLMDGDGNVESGAKNRYSTVSIKLAQNVCHLVKSLGGWATYSKKYERSKLGNRGWCYRVNISHHNKFNPFRIARKANKWKEQKKFLTRGIKSVKFSHYGDGVCFAVDDPAHCFICGDWVVTHNTITQLMRYRRFVGIGYGAYWRGIIFDKEYKNLSDIIAQSKKVFYAFDDGAKFLSSPSDLRWIWPTGEELLFRYVKKVSEYENFHGFEIPFLGWNELTKHSNGELYDKMMSINRSSFVPELHTPKDKSGNFDTEDGNPLPPIPLEVFSTTNPSGPGHNWVKRRFITPARYGEVLKKSVTVFDPRTQKEKEITKSQVALFSSYKENPYLDAKYIANLDELASRNENLRKAWLLGSWDVTAGGALDDIWNADIHVVPRFSIPEGWYVDRAFDWGSSDPASVGWFAEANGEEAIIEVGDKKFSFAPPAGTLIQIEELYYAEEIGSNKGTKAPAADIAEDIIRKENYLLSQGWIKQKPKGGPADNQISQVRESDVETIANKMSNKGVDWTSSDKSSGSRVIGLELIRDRLIAAKRKEGPALYFMQNCVASIDMLPALPRSDKNPNDADTDAEDHAYDMVRYRVLASSNRLAKDLKIKFAF